MVTTLEALHQAIIASPEDRTVRLVYADALDETGDTVDATRAEFIRAQINQEAAPVAMPFHSSVRRIPELFEEHWPRWWRPVCEAAGLPLPYVPRRRLRDRIVRAVGRELKPANWPYLHTEHDTSVHLGGMSIRFVAGFPEEVRFLNMDPVENVPELVHRWGDAMPLVRLAFSFTVEPVQWERIHGPHLERLSELTFDSLLSNTAMLVTGSEHLTALTKLTVNPLGANADTIRFLATSRAWPKLRSLHFTGRLNPDAVRDLAANCIHEHLEELDMMIGTPGLFGGAVAQALTDVIRLFTQSVTFPGTAVVQWADFGPAFEALAAAPWVKKLRRLRISCDSPTGILGLLGERLYGSAERAADLIPDAAVYSLVNAMNPDTLERLTLPGAIIGPSVREELMSRLGTRVAFG
ncbi:MAG: TIGR02996 domain-containing protein [Planctomycetes bacterium]|nr:TIGR02996 domain-containing protein [Planctomycetota bacterium]